MRSKLLPVVLLGFVAELLFGALAPARASVLVDPSYFTGFRETTDTSGTGGGLKWNPAAGSWSAGGFKLSWEISLSGSNYTYKYTIDTSESQAPGGDMSHWLLELSPEDNDGNSLDNYWVDVFGTPGAPGLGDYTSSGIQAIPSDDIGDGADNGASNVGLPAALYGVKFTGSDDDLTWVQFTTPQVPIWGNFYAKDGGGTGPGAVYAYNLGFLAGPTSDTSDFTNWIPRPDGIPGPIENDPIAPEPVSFVVWSLLACVGSLVASRRTRA